MSKPLTEQDLKDIEARAEKATPGPWEDKCGDYIVCRDGYVLADISPVIASPGDAAFIAHAREDVPRLLAEVRRQKDIAAAERALRYAERAAWRLTRPEAPEADFERAQEREDEKRRALRALGVDP